MSKRSAALTVKDEGGGGQNTAVLTLSSEGRPLESDVNTRLHNLCIPISNAIVSHMSLVDHTYKGYDYNKANLQCTDLHMYIILVMCMY